MSSVVESEYAHTSPPEIAVIVNAATVSPARKLSVDELGIPPEALAEEQGNIETNPSERGDVTVTFNATAEALAGMPAVPLRECAGPGSPAADRGTDGCRRCGSVGSRPGRPSR